MKKLDILSRIELGTYSFFGAVVVFGLPAVLVYSLALWFLPAEWPAFLRYGIAVGSGIMAWVLACGVSVMAEDLFKNLRRILRRPSLDEAVKKAERATRGHTFEPEPSPAEADHQRVAQYSWVGKMQIATAFVLVTGGLQYSVTTSGWGGRAAGVLVIVLLYWVVSELVDKVYRYTSDRRRELDLARRQLVAFACALQTGDVEPDDVARVAAAARPNPWSRSPMDDDWAIIGQEWDFWHSGSSQNHASCANCGEARHEHAADGACPA